MTRSWAMSWVDSSRAKGGLLRPSRFGFASAFIVALQACGGTTMIGGGAGDRCEHGRCGAKGSTVERDAGAPLNDGRVETKHALPDGSVDGSTPQSDAGSVGEAGPAVACPAGFPTADGTVDRSC